MSIKKFSDFADEKPFVGDKIRIEDVLNIPIVIRDFRISESKYDSPSCLTLQIEINGQFRVIFTGSVVLVDLMKKYGDQVPFETKIIKADKYYTFS